MTRTSFDNMQAWRHDIHRHPELGFEEARTSGIVARALESFGIETHTGIGGTGVVGVLKKGDGNGMLGMRADMDALKIHEQNDFAHRSTNDGKMHACGHDGHTAMLLGAAEYLASQGNFNGTAVFIFQPAEEHGAGARAMIDDGLFTRFPVDAVYAIHNFPSLATGVFSVREGPVMAAEDNFEIVIEGVGHHAAMPHLGRDPLVVSAEVIMAMQSLVSRTVDPIDNAVLSFTEIETDGTVNVVPSRVVLKGDCRSFTPAMQDHIETTMRRIAEGVCAAHGISCQVSYQRNFVSTINTGPEAEIAGRVAREHFGAARVLDHGKPIMGSEDFGYMLREKPGAYLLLGNGEGGVGGCSLHNPHYDFNDDILTAGADFWVALVESQLAA